MTKQWRAIALLVAFAVFIAPVALVWAPPADTTPPIIQNPSIEPASPTSSDTVTVSVVVRDTGGQASGVNGSRVLIVYSTDNWLSVNITLTATYNATSQTATAQIPPMSGGRVTYYVIAFDNAGNMAINDSNGSYFSYDIPVPEYVSTITYIAVGVTIAAGVGLIAYMMLRPSHKTSQASTSRQSEDG